MAYSKHPSAKRFGSPSSKETQLHRPKIDADALIAAWTRKLAILTGLLVVVTLISSLVSGLQWWEIHNGSADTHALAEAAESQSKAAGLQADAQRRQALIVEANQRPYIGPQGGEITTSEPGKAIVTTLHYQNYGHEAVAVNHETRSFFYDTEKWKKDFGKEDIEKLASQCEIMPEVDGESLGVVFPSNSYFDDDDSVVSDKDYLEGKKTLIRVDCFVYKKDQDRVHTHSCYYNWNGPRHEMKMYSCPYGNFAH